jgi:pimeloyl-ACP methyl ester carboxylesterase
MGWIGARLAIAIALAVAAGALYQIIAERRDLARYRPPGTRVDIGGRRLHLVCSGSGSPTVILEASGLSGHRDWLAVQPEVARFTRVCSYDRAGLGWSDPGPPPRDAQHLAGDLAALLAAAHIDPPWVLVGHSAGGLVVRLHAAAHRDGVKGLVLVDTAPADLADELPAVYARMRRTVHLGHVAARLGLLRALDPFHIDGESRALTYRATVYDATASLVDAIPASGRQLAAAGALVPDLPLVVITHGRGGDWAGPGTIPADEADDVERAWQSAQQRLAALSSRGRVVVAAKSGHMVPAEQPEVVIGAIREVVEAARAQARVAAAAAAPRPAFGIELLHLEELSAHQPGDWGHECASPTTRLSLTPAGGAQFDGDAGKTKLDLKGEKKSSLLLSGLWHCLGYSTAAHAYVLAAELQVGAWIPLREIKYLHDDTAKLVDSRYNDGSWLALAAVPGPHLRYVAFVGQINNGNRVQVLDTLADTIRELAPAPSPPPLPRDDWDRIDSPGDWDWGDWGSDGYTRLDRGIIEFLDERRLRVSYGKDTFRARSRARNSKTFILDQPPLNELPNKLQPMKESPI